MNTENAREENAVRAVLRNEMTWIVFIFGLVWGAVVWVILPINGLQKDNIVLSQKLDSAIALISKQQDAIMLITQNDSNRDVRLSVLESKIK